MLYCHGCILFEQVLTLYQTIPTLHDPEMKPFENIEGKGETVGNQHFLLFPQCFLQIPIRISVLELHLVCRLHMLPIWTSLKVCCLVKS